MRNYLPDHPQIHVYSVDGIFSQNKHTSSRKAPKAILREEMKWLVREIPSIASDGTKWGSPSENHIWEVSLLNTSCHLLFTFISFDNLIKMRYLQMCRIYGIRIIIMEPMKMEMSDRTWMANILLLNEISHIRQGEYTF